MFLEGGHLPALENVMRKLAPVLGVACLLSACTVYPNGAIGLAPLAVAPAVYAPAPYYGYGYGYGYRPYAGGYGYGYRPYAGGYGYGYGRGWGRRW